MFERAAQVADAVLYEGYLLFPYRASARKNQIRWQFGVLAPRTWSEAGGGESWWCQTECLLKMGTARSVTGRLRFLQIERREVQEVTNAAGTEFRAVAVLENQGHRHVPWDEGTEQALDFAVALDTEAEQSVPFELAGGERFDLVHDAAGVLMGRVAWRRWAASGSIGIAVRRLPNDLLRLRVRIENSTPDIASGIDRDTALRHAFVGVHTLLGISGGAFISQIDPSEDAREASARCENVRAFPVIASPVGDDSVMLSSPIVLYDHPEIAPQSQGSMYDGTEIDELLTLCTLTLTDEEKQEARETDHRARAIIDRVEAMSADSWEKLHGTLRPTAHSTLAEAPGDQWLKKAEASGQPQSLQVGSVLVSKGSAVRLRPGNRRSDAQDMFLVGRIGRVEAVMQDVEGADYLAVSIEDDPATELNRWHGRFLYFYPDEIEPIESAP